MMDQYTKYSKGINKLKSGMTAASLYKDHKSDYDGVCTYFNILELMASGLKYNAFDMKICRNYWLHIMIAASHFGKSVIDLERKSSNPELYVEFEKLGNKWKNSLSPAELQFIFKTSTPATPH